MNFIAASKCVQCLTVSTLSSQYNASQASDVVPSVINFSATPKWVNAKSTPLLSALRNKHTGPVRPVTNRYGTIFPLSKPQKQDYFSSSAPLFKEFASSFYQNFCTVHSWPSRRHEWFLTFVSSCVLLRAMTSLEVQRGRKLERKMFGVRQRQDRDPSYYQAKTFLSLKRRRMLVSLLRLFNSLQPDKPAQD